MCKYYSTLDNFERIPDTLISNLQLSNEANCQSTSFPTILKPKRHRATINISSFSPKMIDLCTIPLNENASKIETNIFNFLLKYKIQMCHPLKKKYKIKFLPSSKNSK